MPGLNTPDSQLKGMNVFPIKETVDVFWLRGRGGKNLSSVASPSDSGLEEARTVSSYADTHSGISQGFKKPQALPRMYELSESLQGKDNFCRSLQSCCETSISWEMNPQHNFIEALAWELSSVPVHLSLTL